MFFQNCSDNLFNIDYPKSMLNEVSEKHYII